jgi:HD-like signal output (HDOD) protein
LRTVLVVEPNEQVAEGYRRLLRVYSNAWSLAFAKDAPGALAAVAAGAASVVIADARTADLEPMLLELKTRWPSVARVVLAGPEVKEKDAYRLGAVAQQVLRKPFIPTQLFDLVERTCQVVGSLHNPRLQVVLGQLGALPALPQTYARLAELSGDPRATLDEMATVAERDPAIAGAVLRIINSAYFGLPRRVSSVRETVRYLGIQPLKNIVLTVEIFEGLASGKAAKALQETALSRALAMREVLGRTPHAEAAFAAGILADLGHLLLVTRLPIDAAALQKASDGGQLPWDAEQARLGCTHADLGAAILASWNLPASLVEAVALHHQPPRASPAPSVATALALVTAVEYSFQTRDQTRQDLLDTVELLAPAFPTLQLDSVREHFHRVAQSA